MKQEIPYRLISKHFAGESSEQEDQELWAWASESDLHLETLQQFVSIYNSSDQISLGVEEKNAILKKVISEKRISVTPVSFDWIRIAASLLLFCSLGTLLFVSFTSEEVSYSTGSGEVKRVILPDSSIVWMNGNSMIQFSLNEFTTTRSVSIEGEVFFMIRAYANQAFQVSYDSIVATLTSGQINIQSFTGDREKIAIVSEGVAVFEDLRKDGFKLSATTGDGVTSLSDYGLLSVEVNNNVNFDSWMSKTYAFDGAPLVEIMEVLYKGRDSVPAIPNKSLRYKTYSKIYEGSSEDEIIETVLAELNAVIATKNGTLQINEKSKI